RHFFVHFFAPRIVIPKLYECIIRRDGKLSRRGNPLRRKEFRHFSVRVFPLAVPFDKVTKKVTVFDPGREILFYIQNSTHIWHYSPFYPSKIHFPLNNIRFFGRWF
ncbi:MAG: hypothetical protein J6Z79_02210, partial [Clostridia bacterium]|nr:hypothetical protein [Clostridia bacterium]